MSGIINCNYTFLLQFTNALFRQLKTGLQQKMFNFFSNAATSTRFPNNKYFSKQEIKIPKQRPTVGTIRRKLLKNQRRLPGKWPFWETKVFNVREGLRKKPNRRLISLFSPSHVKPKWVKPNLKKNNFGRNRVTDKKENIGNVRSSVSRFVDRDPTRISQQPAR